jgi:hypothetical protein
MPLDHQHIVDAISSESRPLSAVTIPLQSWDSLRRWLHSLPADYVAVHIGAAHGSPAAVVVIGTAPPTWEGARRVSQTEAIRLARLWLRLRYDGEVSASPRWWHPSRPCTHTATTTPAEAR